MPFTQRDWLATGAGTRVLVFAWQEKGNDKNTPTWRIEVLYCAKFMEKCDLDKKDMQHFVVDLGGFLGV